GFQWILLSHFLFSAFIQCLGKLRFDKRRGDSVYANIGAKLGCKCARKMRDASFADAIQPDPGTWHFRSYRGEVDNTAVIFLKLQPWVMQGFLNPSQRADDIHTEYFLCSRKVEIF